MPELLYITRFTSPASLSELTAPSANLPLVTAKLLILVVVTALPEMVVAPSPEDVTSPVWLGCE